MGYCDWAITIDGTTHPFGSVEVAGWDIAGRDYREDDTDRPRADDRYMGQDFATPGDIEIDVIIRQGGKTNQEKFDNAWALRKWFTQIWNGDTIRFTPGKLAELRVAGKAIVEGRPRSLDWDDSLAKFGIIKGTAVFVRSSTEVFSLGDDGEGGTKSVTVGLVPPQVGGLVAPLIAPLSTTAASTRARPFEVLSEVPVWPVIKVHGPINKGATVELTNGWTLRVNRALAYDEVATFDSRPGKASMDLNGRVFNLLDPTGARLSQLSIAPGLQEIALRGTSLEGTAYVTAEWREGTTGL